MGTNHIQSSTLFHDGKEQALSFAHEVALNQLGIISHVDDNLGRSEYILNPGFTWADVDAAIAGRNNEVNSGKHALDEWAKIYPAPTSVPFELKATGSVFRGMNQLNAAKAYADQVAQFFHSHGLNQSVFVVKGPTSTTKCKFEIVTATAGYSVVYRSPSSEVVDSSPVFFSTDANSVSKNGVDSPIKTLRCCCCGESTRGRQFDNQDIGFGLGSCCVGYVTQRETEMERTYGIDGVHYNVSDQALVIAVLKAHGWTPVYGAAICIKSYETAVGKKEAHAYFSAGDGFNRTLSGDYLTEGRNALEPHCVLIPVNATDSEICHFTTQFAVNADAVVATTYAASLHRLVAS